MLVRCNTALSTALVPALLLLCILLAPPAAATGADPDGIVYVRVPRSTTTIHITEADGYKDPEGNPITGDVDPSFFDTLPEVHFIHRGFNAPGQLVWRHADGTETIIFDCTGGNPAQHDGAPVNGGPTCVPMDPAVSYDGRKLAFSVYHGTYDGHRELSQHRNGEVGKMILDQANPGWASIHIYDFATRQITAWPHQNQVWDTAPAWLPNGKIVFTSTRAGVFQPYVAGAGVTTRTQQMWIANADGSNARNIDPHDQQNALHPFVHSAGRIFYSSHQFNVVRVNAETESNLWWLESVDLRGGDLNAHLHAHRFSWPGLNLTLTALHFLGERSNGDMCSDMYYRRNNFGAGSIVCWNATGPEVTRSPLGHEGPYPFKTPDNFYIAVTGSSSDFEGGVRVRDPAGLPGGQLLFAGSIGPDTGCHWTLGMQRMIDQTNLGKSCDMGIYHSNGIPVDAPNGYKDDGLDNGAIKSVNDPAWHEFMPKPVMPYSAVYGIEKPAQPALSNTGDSDTSYGIFASVNGQIGDVLALGGWQGPKNPDWCRLQGCALQAVPLDKIKAMRFWRIIPNRRVYRGYDPLLSNWGQKLELIGDVPVQPDRSFKARLPSDTPFLMSGIDAKGRSIARHQQPMSLRPGEKQVCSGCHLHDPTDAENAQYPFDETLAASLPPVSPSLTAGEMGVLEWKADIYTMLKDNCGSCHNGTGGSNPPSFTDTPAAVYKTLFNDGLPANPLTDDGTTRARVPWLTRYVNAFFARESLLYWKAAGQRLDGRTDATRTDDFDFGPAHPAHLDAAQLGKLADWIEAGAYMDQHADVDIIFRDDFE